MRAHFTGLIFLEGPNCERLHSRFVFADINFTVLGAKSAKSVKIFPLRVVTYIYP